MSSGFPGGDSWVGRSTAKIPIQLQFQRMDGGGGGLLKRPLTEMERQQQQLQELYIRTVKQKIIQQTSPISPLSPIDFSAISPDVTTTNAVSSSSSSSCSTRQPVLYGHPNNGNHRFSISASPPPPTSVSPDLETKMKNRLQELERQLLNDDDDEDENQGGGTNNNGSSVVTSGSDWCETMQSLIAPIKPPSPSPTSSSSSISSTSTATARSLRQLLSDAASAISEGNRDAASAILGNLRRSANPRGDPEQRLASYMTSALLSRLSGQIAGSDDFIGSAECLIGTQMLYDASPCFKLGFLAANHVILEATKAQSKIHIVDFDIGRGRQYAALLHSLKQQRRPAPSSIRITAAVVSDLPQSSTPDGLKEVGNLLVGLGERLGVAVRFNVVRCRTSELDRKAIGCGGDDNDDEAVAVSFAYGLQKVADESVSTENPRDELLRRVKREIRPEVVVLMEQDLNTNTAPFAARFGEVMAHVGSVFESLDATMARENPDRARIEECLGRRSHNMVAAEGARRVWRCEVFGKWRARLGMAGFRPRPVEPGVAEWVRARLGSCRVNPGFTFKDDETGGLCFGWRDRVLTFASAWH
ncbi:Scarecrow-like protein 8 [Acorus gramineus]|uniref:Scarecrow-like protein 8 n=1 Tax=Acorus gramineus TaxID=55184 RepID=A0AAV9AC81_ACOGR|nr:Scarecrow-like protein 8 [Acorus gramineus]